MITLTTGQPGAGKTYTLDPVLHTCTRPTQCPTGYHIRTPDNGQCEKDCFGDQQQQVIAIANQAGGAVGGGAGINNLASQAMQFAAYAGLFDALNIVISGYMAYTSLMSVRFIVGRLK